MSEATKCDRCGKYIDMACSDVPRIAHCLDMKHERYNLSLCFDCYDKFFTEFLMTEPIKENENV